MDILESVSIECLDIYEAYLNINLNTIISITDPLRTYTDSLLTSTDSLPTYTDSLPTSTDSLPGFTDFTDHYYSKSTAQESGANKKVVETCWNFYVKSWARLD